MNETLSSRVKRIVAGGAHAIVDAIEDVAPEVVMEQAIREIDGAIDDVRAELGKVLANKHLATKRLGEENGKHEALGERIELALNEQREDLAEAAISQQLDIEAQLPVIEGAIRDGSDAEKELEGYLSALGAKRREMIADVQAFRAAREQASGAAAVPGHAASSDVERRVARAEAAFERLIVKHTGLPPGSAPGDRKTAAQLAELEDLSRQNQIRERLAVVKAKLG